MKTVKEFLEGHRLLVTAGDIDNLVRIFMEDMSDGLRGKEGALRMIPTYIEAENDFHREIPVLAIDAGGTNFRASLISFNSDGHIAIGKICNHRMPGIDSEISAEEFFSTIAGYIKHLADRAERIGFCFSYPSEIFPDKDGKLIQFCKEVKAPDVVGKMIGKNLLDTLGTPEKPVVLLNDTVAALLAGKSEAINKSYDSFIGYILGTGTNTCYIERNRNIIKNRRLDQNKSQIVNIESGNFKKSPRSDLDIVYDNTTFDPGSYMFEKMFSGGYFGGLTLTVLKAAAREGVFSGESSEKLNKLALLTSNDVNNYVNEPRSKNNNFNECFRNDHEKEAALEIINALVDRAAVLSASNLAAVVLWTGKGKLAEKPVLITIEGTTFYKLHNLKERFEKYFTDYLSAERKRYVEFAEVENASLKGAALAALID